MADEQQFCLRWNNFQMNITSQFEALRDEEDFVDVTLACEGQRLKAHKVVLSACSPYFKELFKSNPCKHPILFMRDVEFRHLKSLVEFMYAGEVNVAQAQLSAFLRTAESLQIRGLTEAPQRHSRFDGATSDTGHSRRGTRSGIPTSPIAGAPEEDDILSLSPPASPSPPAKRPCTAPDPANIKREAPDIVEPKLEVPDYSSDGESRTESGNGAHYGGIENPLDAKSAYATGGLQGGMEMIPGTSAAHNFLSDVSTLPQEPASQAADHRKLHSLDPRPCPICYRMYSNLSNLRQHLRLIHNPQTVACPLCSKPFKTKLYLKRHLMSFHELLCGPPKQQQQPPPHAVPATAASSGLDFFPPPPQVVLSEEKEEFIGANGGGGGGGSSSSSASNFRAPPPPFASQDSTVFSVAPTANKQPAN
ncbi:protein abrupt-like isoform X3 [Schistocerca americana]|uniref:protein abrupt-like isoform X3 n=1 Tax=Schistocerca americana TaxID=7009 RepID=UPI001F4FDC4B|nr:protein abrupt-like isoform X3 [Schistocerca americana]XP_049862080.1 protein abrupt-like isoform X2 [Schistocerca gregaria]XP_049862089.1 protein abrupt-like isoform X2 [Schistocerca gregaria]XP_049862093.1 protein abrupt-like isoform X2 [Schistocerca gregaria]